MPKVLLPLAQGFEEIELVSIADVLRRGGVDVVLASLGSELEVSGAHNIIIKADVLLGDIKPQEYDGVALHGGMEGVQNMLKSTALLQIIKDFANAGKICGAICAGPLVFDELKLLVDDFCCYPECERLMKYTQSKRLHQAFNISNHLITATGPAFAISFALALLSLLVGEDKQREIQSQLLL